MNKELALRTFGYLIGHYKTHNETTINKQEIEAIEFMLKNNEDLEQQVKKQKEVIDKIDKYIKENIYSYYDSKGEKCIEETVFERNANPKELLDILKEVSERTKKIEYEQIEELTCNDYDFEKKTINSLIRNQKKLIDEINNLKEKKDE